MEAQQNTIRIASSAWMNRKFAYLIFFSQILISHHDAQNGKNEKMSTKEDEGASV